MGRSRDHGEMVKRIFVSLSVTKIFASEVCWEIYEEPKDLDQTVVFHVPEGYAMLLSAAQCCSVLLSAAQCCSVLLSAAQCSGFSPITIRPSRPRQVGSKVQSPRADWVQRPAHLASIHIANLQPAC